jgi:hypothetical protein
MTEYLLFPTVGNSPYDVFAKMIQVLYTEVKQYGAALLLSSVLRGFN